LGGLIETAAGWANGEPHDLKRQRWITFDSFAATALLMLLPGIVNAVVAVAIVGLFELWIRWC
jgi:hypothetical protein